MADRTTRRIVLARRPQGEVRLDDFRLEEAPLDEPGPGEVLARTVWLSLDPYMRGRMSERKGYADNVKPGQVMVGGTVSQVVKSKNKDFKEGDYVADFAGWQSYSLSNGMGVRKLDPNQAPLSTALSVLGMPGMTAWYGLHKIGRPKAGETVVVSAASGAVGSVVGQLAKLAGCRAVGIAGGKDKCDYVVQELGFDACVDYKAEGKNLSAALRNAAPKGVDVYFENVGGDIGNAVLAQMNDFGRVPLCGMISQYNATDLPAGPNWALLLIRRLLVQGFIVSDHFARLGEFIAEVGPAVKGGKIKYREDIAKGIDQAPQAFMGLLKGKNFGKQLVQVADDPTRK
jgi:NADPH-dependent curcumin reductase CurA